jgi:hypothetical protein
MLLRLLSDLFGGRKAAPVLGEGADEVFRADLLQAQSRFSGEHYFQVLVRIIEALRSPPAIHCDSPGRRPSRSASTLSRS